MNWYGLWRTLTTKNIKKLFIGEQLCDRFAVIDGINNLNDDTAISDAAFTFVSCNVAEEMVSGLYKVSAQTYWGNPRLHDSTFTLTADA